MDFKFKYRKYAEALYSALREDAFYITLEESIEDGESSKEAMLRYMEYSMIEGEKSGELYIPEDHEYGVSIWTMPMNSELEAKKHHEKEKFLLYKMGDKSLKIYNAIVDIMSVNAEPFIGNDFWYLSIVGVRPEFQGQGLGAGLIRDVLKRADTLQVSTYLETFTSRNMTFYKRLGYKEVKSFHEPTTKAEYWLMIREPSKS